MALSKINLQSSEAIASLNEERPLLSRRAHPVRLPDIQRSFLSGDPPEIYPKGHKLRISAVYEKNPLRPLGEPDSKSCALPLGDIPVYAIRQKSCIKKENGVSEGTRTLGLQSHNLTR